MQDYWFALSGLFYFAAMLPACRDHATEIPRWSSFLTSATMSVSSFAYVTLDMRWAALSMAVGAVQWIFLYGARPVRPVVTEDDTDVYVSIPLTEAEYGVVNDYRRWVQMQQLVQQHQAETEAAHEQKLAGGGCGGCPSMGSCSEAEPEVGDSSL